VLPSSARALRNRDLLEDLQDGARSALEAAATRVAGAATQAESAISSAAATVQSIEDYVPRNCSLGTKRFCIGYKQDVNCSGLPLNLTSLLPVSLQELPGPVENAIRDRVETLSQLADSSTRFSAFSVSATLISGLVLMIMVVVLALSLSLGRPQVITGVFGKLRVVSRALALLTLGLVCCFPFVLLAVILHTVLKAARGLPSWVEVKTGEACSRLRPGPAVRLGCSTERHCACARRERQGQRVIESKAVDDGGTLSQTCPRAVSSVST
jgi:hypothetical protein